MAKTQGKTGASKGGGFLSQDEIEKSNEESDKRASNKPQPPPGVYKEAKVVDIEVTKSKAGQPQVIIEVEADKQYRTILIYSTFGPGEDKVKMAKDKFLSFFYTAFGHVFEPVDTDDLTEGITEAVNQVKKYIGKPYQEVIRHEQNFYGKMDSNTGKTEIKETWDAKHWYAVLAGKPVNFNEAGAQKYLNEKDAIALKERILKNSIKPEGKEVAAEDIPDYMKDNATGGDDTPI